MWCDQLSPHRGTKVKVCVRPRIVRQWAMDRAQWHDPPAAEAAC
jgi:hypothetical protein